MSKVKAFFEFIRLTDEQGRLSLTNIALVAALVSILMRPELSVTDVVTVVAALAGYQFKRFVQPTTPEQEDLRKTIESLQTKVTALQMGSKYQR